MVSALVNKMLVFEHFSKETLLKIYRRSIFMNKYLDISPEVQAALLLWRAPLFPTVCPIPRMWRLLCWLSRL
jgi:hypothetical protein